MRIFSRHYEPNLWHYYKKFKQACTHSRYILEVFIFLHSWWNSWWTRIFLRVKTLRWWFMSLRYFNDRSRWFFSMFAFSRLHNNNRRYNRSADMHDDHGWNLPVRLPPGWIHTRLSSSRRWIRSFQAAIAFIGSRTKTSGGTRRGKNATIANTNAHQLFYAWLVYYRYVRRRFTNAIKMSSNFYRLIMLIGVFFFFLMILIAGSMWVYKEYEPNYDPSIGKYCNKTLYLFAFWLITCVYIALGVITACLCSISVASIAFQRRPPNLMWVVT